MRANLTVASDAIWFGLVNASSTKATHLGSARDSHVCTLVNRTTPTITSPLTLITLYSLLYGLRRGLL